MRVPRSSSHSWRSGSATASNPTSASCSTATTASPTASPLSGASKPSACSTARSTFAATCPHQADDGHGPRRCAGTACPYIVVKITTSFENAMERTVSAAEANRRFSELLRSVKRGESVLVTSHGKPVARIVPASEPEATHRAARSILLSRLRRERVVTSGRWTRAELYEGTE